MPVKVSHAHGEIALAFLIGIACVVEKAKGPWHGKPFSGRSAPSAKNQAGARERPNLPVFISKSTILKNTGYPSIDLLPAGRVGDAEARLESMLVTHHATVKPRGASGEQYECEPRPERKGEPHHKNEMSEIHRVSGVPLRTAGDDPLLEVLPRPPPARTRR